MVGDDEPWVGHEVGGRVAERAAPLVAVRHRPADLERRAQVARGGRHVTRRHEPADVSRGDDLAVQLDEPGDARLERVLGGQQLASPRARCPKRKFSPTETRSAPRRSTSSRSMNSSGDWAANEPSNGMTTSSSHPEAGDQVGLRLERHQQLGRRSGRHDGARVGLEGQHGVRPADDFAVAEVHAVELAHGDLARGAAGRRGAR